MILTVDRLPATPLRNNERVNASTRAALFRYFDFNLIIIIIKFAKYYLPTMLRATIEFFVKKINCRKIRTRLLFLTRLSTSDFSVRSLDAARKS